MSASTEPIFVMQMQAVTILMDLTLVLVIAGIMAMEQVALVIA